jgi:hypothetical protein
MHTIISQIITLLLHVSTLLCHPQAVRSQYITKLHKHIKCSSWQRNLKLKIISHLFYAVEISILQNL